MHTWSWWNKILAGSHAYEWVSLYTCSTSTDVNITVTCMYALLLISTNIMDFTSQYLIVFRASASAPYVWYILYIACDTNSEGVVCSGHGDCTEPSPGQFVCVCDYTYTGTACESSE